LYKISFCDDQVATITTNKLKNDAMGDDLELKIHIHNPSGRENLERSNKRRWTEN
jgi:hypothetical protein